ncbi:unnamed protein product, partial [Prorocentrum cordatum]
MRAGRRAPSGARGAALPLSPPLDPHAGPPAPGPQLICVIETRAPAFWLGRTACEMSPALSVPPGQCTEGELRGHVNRPIAAGATAHIREAHRGGGRGARAGPQGKPSSGGDERTHWLRIVPQRKSRDCWGSGPQPAAWGTFGRVAWPRARGARGCGGRAHREAAGDGSDAAELLLLGNMAPCPSPWPSAACASPWPPAAPAVAAVAAVAVAAVAVRAVAA